MKRYASFRCWFLERDCYLCGCRASHRMPRSREIFYPKPLNAVYAYAYICYRHHCYAAVLLCGYAAVLRCGCAAICDATSLV
jgi:hypothetical protein